MSQFQLYEFKERHQKVAAMEGDVADLRSQLGVLEAKVLEQAA